MIGSDALCSHDSAQIHKTSVIIATIAYLDKSHPPHERPGSTFDCRIYRGWGSGGVWRQPDWLEGTFPESSGKPAAESSYRRTDSAAGPERAKLLPRRKSFWKTVESDDIYPRSFGYFLIKSSLGWAEGSAGKRKEERKGFSFGWIPAFAGMTGGWRRVGVTGAGSYGAKKQNPASLRSGTLLVCVCFTRC